MSANSWRTSAVTGEPVAPQKLTDLTVRCRAAGLAAVQQSELRAGHADDRQGRHLSHGDVAGVPSSTGDFDVKEALKHADGDAELSENFKQLNASHDNFRGSRRRWSRAATTSTATACTATTASSSRPGAPPAEPALPDPVHGHRLRGQGPGGGTRHRGHHQGIRGQGAQSAAGSNGTGDSMGSRLRTRVFAMS